MPYQRIRTPIGKRNVRVTIRYPETVDDGMGGQTVTWKKLATPWAEVEALDERSKESLSALHITAEHAYHVNIRFRADVTKTMQASWSRRGRSHTCEIHSVGEDTAKPDRLILLCAEVQ